MEENKMNFKVFFENFEAIVEAAKITMGDYTEALFAIGLLQYTLKKSVSESDIFNLMNEIPSLPYENTFSHDNYEVALHLHGKEGMANLFGGNFAKLSLDHQTQIKDIITKIATHIPKLKTIHKVDAFIAKARGLESNKFIIVIKSTGSKTSQEGGTKADVTMEVIPKESTPIPNDIRNIRYSVKYSKDKTESKMTEASIFNLILRLGNAFKLPMTQGLEGMRVLPHRVNSAAVWLFNTFGDGPRVVLTPEQEKNKELSFKQNHLYNFIRRYFTEEKGDKTLVLKQFSLEFNNEMVVREKQQPAFSKILYDFLEKEIFGQDLADIVKVDSIGVKEVDIEAYNKIRNNYLVDFSTRPTKSKELIFKFEAIAKDGSSFLLFWIENHRDGTVQVHIGGDLLK